MLTGEQESVLPQEPRVREILARREAERLRQSPYEARCIADIPSEPIQWLWPSRFALGKVSVIAGMPGLAKSQITIAMAAVVTARGRWPDGSAAPLGSAIFVTCEDDPADTIRPRLEAAGADISKVHVLDWALEADKKGKATKRHFNIGKHAAAIGALCRDLGDVRLVVIDPVTAYLGDADSHKTADVRAALAPIQAIAAEYGVAVILVSHLNKSTGGDAINRVVGSGAFVAVARSAWIVALDPNDADQARRIMAPLKNNIGDDKSGFAFAVEGVSLPGGITTSHVVWDREPVQVSPAELLATSQPETEEDRGAMGEAEEFLREYLADGPKTTKSVQKDAKAAGISERTLKRARRRLGVKASKSGVTGNWVLALPQGGQEGQGGQPGHG